MNLVGYLQKASEYLEERGIESARLNAEVLLCSVTGLSRLELYTNYNRPLKDREASEYRELLKRRAIGEPLQYITGEAHFYGLDFNVGPGVFIPRQETEILVEKALEVLPAGTSRVLDLCTGCGNVAIAIAAARPEVIVVATDVDSAALTFASGNTLKHGLDGRIELMTGNLYEPVEAGAVLFDLVVSNPPYVPVERWESLPVEVREHEPHRALLAGSEGTDILKPLIDGAQARLAGGGWMVLEVDASHASAVERSLVEGSWSKVSMFEDLAGRPRVLRARKAGA